MTRLQRLQEEANTAAKAAREIAEKAQAESRAMTDAERGEFDGHMAKGRDLLAQIRAAKADEAVLDQAKALADELGMDGAKADLDAQKGILVPGSARVPLAQQVVKSAQFTAMMGAFGTDEFGRKHIPERQRVQSDPIQVKGLFVGGSATSAGAFVVPDRTDIVEPLGRRELRLRDLISVRRTGSDTVEYVVQTSHTNAAAPVAEATSSAAPTAPGTAGALVLDANGGYKPEGAWAFQRKTATVKTIAEWVPATKRALADVAQLEGLINDELEADLAETEETQILSGSGSGENLTGILSTSGIQTQAKGSDTLFVAVRKALTKARTVGRVAPNGIVMNPAEVEKVDTAVDGQTRFYGQGPFGIGPRTLWGVPVVESEAISAGTALLGDFSKAVLWDREQTTVTMTDSHADFFIRNLVAILAEERIAFAVTRPTAFVTVTGL
ncbi:phage major capsid protein [Sphaerisporangium sp. NPDC004334]